MKATITIEIEGDPQDINAITKSIQSFARQRQTKVNIKPRDPRLFPGMFPNQPTQKNKW